MNQIEWRQVPEWEGVYEVSSAGHVRRALQCKGTRAGRCLNPAYSDRRAYYYVILCHAGKKVTLFVHGIVAAAFFGPRPDGHEVNHKDGNKRNNHVTNLEYVTRSENVKHAARLGLTLSSESRRVLKAVKECGCSHCRWLMEQVNK